MMLSEIFTAGKEDGRVRESGDRRVYAAYFDYMNDCWLNCLPPDAPPGTEPNGTWLFAKELEQVTLIQRLVAGRVPVMFVPRGRSAMSWKSDADLQ